MSYNRIRKVSPAGVITTVAGTGSSGYAGDGGTAAAAHLNRPAGVAVGPDGSVYVADSSNHRVRRVGVDGTISTVAGTGVRGYSGDGGPATGAQLAYPSGVAVGADGSVYIADRYNNRIRRVSPDGAITTVAGSGSTDYGSFGGDGGPALSAWLSYPQGVAVAADGSLYIADTSNFRIRAVSPSGVITTVAGSGVCCGGAEGVPAVATQLNRPCGVAVDGNGHVYIADTWNHLIRKVWGIGTPPATPTVTPLATLGF